jgi:hypothetical protein
MVWKKGDKDRASNPCSTFYPDPKTIFWAIKKFLTWHKTELAFIINFYSNVNAFIYPFNGRQKNDIE